MPSFRDDHILIISPGSQTTLAQLGLPESFTPAKVRIPSRMFPGLEEGTWTPVKIREVREGEDLGALLGVKPSVKKKNPAAKVKKDVVVGTSAPKSAGLPTTQVQQPPAGEEGTVNVEGTTGEVVAPTTSAAEAEKVPEEAATANATTAAPTEPESTTSAATPTTGASAPTPTKAAAPPANEDQEMEGVDDNEEEDNEEGDDAEDGEEPEPEAEGEEPVEVDEIVLSDDEEIGEGEEIIEDIIDIPETENGAMYIEDDDDEEGAVWPMVKGRVTNWGAFFALLTYVHESISPTFHTPLLIVCPPVWTQSDKELVTQFVFEKLKAPGLCLLDAAIAVCWAYGLSTATIVDVGLEKTDITPVVDFIACEIERDTIPIGGEDMTLHLSKILGGEEKGWGRDMAEQLKCSNICEILDASKSMPGLQVEKKGKNLEDEEEEEGITNVAAIVASGKTHEYLAKKEREKQEAQRGIQKHFPNWKKDRNTFWVTEKRKEGDNDVVMGDQWDSNTQTTTQPSDQAAEAPAPAADHNSPAASATAPPLEKPKTPEAASTSRPPTSSGTAPSSRPTTSSGPAPAPSSRPGTSSGTATAAAPPSESTTTTGDAPPPPPPAAPPVSESEETRFTRERLEAKEKRREEKKLKGEHHPVNTAPIEIRPNEIRREIEVGTERFKPHECGIISILADAIYRIINRVDEIPRRQELWENIVVVGNGSRIKGFKDSLFATMIERYRISPSSATMFTSEIPSNSSTGANTPQPLPPGSLPPPPPQPSGVNPLLIAATTNSTNSLHFQNQNLHHQHAQTFSQSPTAIRTPKVPEYFPEWKDAGFEESSFLGAQVAAKVVFVVDQGISRGFLSRVEYNELGPGGIHSV